jgi:hypothetical protein
MIKRLVVTIAVMLAMVFTGCKSSGEAGATAPKKGRDGGVYARYNFLGYTPNRQKRMLVMAERNIAGKEWAFINTETGDTVQKGRFDNSISGRSGHMPLDYNYVIDFSGLTQIGEYSFVTEGLVNESIIPIAEDPYSWIVNKPIRWMRAARCGYENPLDREGGACHMGDKSCVLFHRRGADNATWHDAGANKQMDITGGWHDAGDYVKFSLTIGYATYFLLRSYDVNPELFEDMKNYSTSELNDLLDEAKWGLDWLMKTMTDRDTNEFVVQVANYEDHNVGYRLAHRDNLDGKRPILSALSPHQMGYTAASLALGAKILKELGNEAIAKQYEAKARLIFRRATSSDAVPMAAYDDKVNTWYGDGTVNDNLALAAAELYRLTGEDFYKEESIKYSGLARTAGWRAWESVNMPAHLRVMEWYPIAKNDLYADLEGFLANARRPGNVWGLPIKYVWGGLYSYIAIGANAFEFQLFTGERKFEELGRNMFDYLLGYNNWGIVFVATTDPRLAGRTITDPNSQLYGLQADKFPEGAISEGPGDRASWERFKTYFGFDVEAQRTSKFNTSEGVFFDHRKDFMCMETTIAGVADGVFMLAVANKFFSDLEKNIK